jgi:hypothetical protein
MALAFTLDEYVGLFQAADTAAFFPKKVVDE